MNISNYFKIVNDDIPNDKSDMSILLHECSEKGGPAISVIWESHQKWIEEEIIQVKPVL